MPTVKNKPEARQSSPMAVKKKPTARPDKREALNMRVRPEVRSLIDRAASLTGKNRTDFVLDAARLAAQDALLDQTVIPLTSASYAAFVALLDAPPQANERLRKTMLTKPPWSEHNTSPTKRK